MKLAVSNYGLLSALMRVQGVVERRHSISILQNLLLEAEGKQLTITAFDTMVEAVAHLECEVNEAGHTAVLAHELCGWVRKLDGTDVQAILDGGFLSLECGRPRAKLPVRDAVEYPRFILDEDDARIKVQATNLGAMLEKTSFAASTDEIRHYLNGVFFHVKAQDDGSLWVCTVATDGHRLASIKSLAPEGTEAPEEDSPLRRGIIIPRKTIAMLRPLLKEQSAETLVTITLARNGVRFELPQLTLTSKLLGGDFPDYERVIPKENPKTLSIDRKALRQAIERVAVLADRNKAIHLHCLENQVTVSALGDDGRKASEEVDCSYDHDELEIGFNYGYLLDILVHTGEVVRFNLDSTYNPVVIDCDDGALFVLMPMRV